MPYEPLKYWNKRKHPNNSDQLLDFEKRHIQSFLKDSTHLLDFGVGDGRTFEAYPPMKVKGMDIVLRYHKQAFERARECNLDYSHIIYRELPYKHYFSHAIACKVLLHITEPKPIIDYLARVADKVLIIDTCDESQRAQHVRVHDFNELLQGYKILEYEENCEHIAIVYENIRNRTS